MTRETNYPKYLGFALSEATYTFVTDRAWQQRMPAARLGRALFEYAVKEFQKNPGIIEV